MRALNVVSTPNWHGNFYIQNIGKPKNILVVSTADATILEHIEAGLGSLEKANIWVADLCPTPLEICRRYAKLRKHIIHTAQINALSLAEDGLSENFFDRVITDAFVSRFPTHDEKDRLLTEWHKILAPGGLILTTCRVTGMKKEVGTEEEVRTFVDKTVAVFNDYKKKNPQILSYINDQLVQEKAYEYASHITSYPPMEDELKDLFVKNGFELLSFQKNNVPGEFKHTVYAQIVAKKV